MKNINIKDKFIISIVDNNGIRQFSIHRLIKKVLLYSLAFIIIIAIVVFFTIKFLANELKNIQNYKDDTIEKYIDIYNKNQNLAQQVDISQNILDEINQKMIDLEDIISMKNAIVEPDNSNLFNIDLLTLGQREAMLKILPNALPFDNSLDLEPTFLKSGVTFNTPLNTPIYATADGIIDLTRDNDTKTLGRFVKIVHSFGFTSIYGNLSKISVQRGGIVKKGQVIGYSGKSNNKESLFYDIRFLGSEVNLQNFIAWNINNFEVVMDDSIIDWNSLLWTFSDIMQISNHKIFNQANLEK